ncbi:MAG TPA: hypothetical protein VEC36_11810 [Patescibacteria group bacterium]|nr:hypothetical protein [Patescibacteria group bacterium]
MNFSPDTEAVLQFLDGTTNNNLRKRNDLGTILEVGAENDAFELVNSIIFTGSALWKLFNTLKKTGPNAEGYKVLETEFANVMNDLRAQLAEIAGFADEQTITRFENVYLGVNGGVIRNLTDLAHDLGALKSVQNDQKYSGSDDAPPMEN